MSISTTIVIRMEIQKSVTSFAEVATVITAAGGDIVAIDVIRSGEAVTVRDVTVNLRVSANDGIIRALTEMPGIHVINVSDQTFLVHLGGRSK